MATVSRTLKRNDTAPALIATLEDANGPVNIAGASVRFHMVNVLTGEIKVDAAASVTDGAAGEVTYAWQAGDTDTSGTYYVEFEVTFLDGTVATFPSRGTTLIVIEDDLA